MNSDPCRRLIRINPPPDRRSYCYPMDELRGRANAPATVVEQQQVRDRDLITVVRELVRELHPQRVRFIDVLP
jgi:hypothetical protein